MALIKDFHLLYISLLLEDGGSDRPLSDEYSK